MKTEDFDFELPEELIAQTPINKRDNIKPKYKVQDLGLFSFIIIFFFFIR